MPSYNEDYWIHVDKSNTFFRCDGVPWRREPSDNGALQAKPFDFSLYVEETIKYAETLVV